MRDFAGYTASVESAGSEKFRLRARLCPTLTLVRDGKISRNALESVLLRNQIENTDLQVTYQPEGVSLRLGTQPEANAFRLI